jgi:uncharacterized protein (TIGR02996 family)
VARKPAKKAVSLEGDAQAEELLAKVLSAPLDLAPRKVYADYLDERGDPRGEFIDLQLRLASGEAGDDEEKLTRRAQRLLSKHRAAWLGRFRESFPRLALHRGFVEQVTADAIQFVTGGEALLAREPVTDVTIMQLTPTLLVRLVDLPGMERVTSLDLSANGLDETAARRIAAGTRWTSLAVLFLGYNVLGAAGTRALLEGERLHALKVLSLDANGLGDAGAEAFVAAAGTALPQLTRLHLAKNELTEAGVATLAASPALGKLARLSLGHNSVGDAGAVALASSLTLRNLRVLDLTHASVGAEGALALAASKLPRLEQVLLPENPIGPVAQAALRERFPAG